MKTAKKAYLSICILVDSHALDTKQHYYFDTQEKRYFHLTNTLSEAQKQIIHQKIETEINMVKKLAAANNLALWLTSTVSSLCTANAIQRYFRLTNDENLHDLHIGIILTGTTAILAIRSYIFKNDINRKLAKLAFKQSLLNN